MHMQLNYGDLIGQPYAVADENDEINGLIWAYNDCFHYDPMPFPEYGQEKLEDLLRVLPNNPELLLRRSLFYRDKWMLEAAEEDLVTILAESAEHQGALELRGQTRFLRGNMPGAWADLSQLNFENIMPLTRLYVAHFLIENKQYEQAHQQLDRLLKNDSSTEVLEYQQDVFITMHDKFGDLEDEHKGHALFLRQKIYEKIGEHDKRLPLLNKLLASDPDHMEGLKARISLQDTPQTAVDKHRLHELMLDNNEVPKLIDFAKHAFFKHEDEIYKNKYLFNIQYGLDTLREVLRVEQVNEENLRAVREVYGRHPDGGSIFDQLDGIDHALKRIRPSSL